MPYLMIRRLGEFANEHSIQYHIDKYNKYDARNPECTEAFIEIDHVWHRSPYCHALMRPGDNLAWNYGPRNERDPSPPYYKWFCFQTDDMQWHVYDNRTKEGMEAATKEIEDWLKHGYTQKYSIEDEMDIL
jgi:hypothetical protein